MVQAERALTSRRNLITDVAGLTVGHAHDARVASGVTVILFDPGTVTSGIVPGGAPGGRDLNVLDPSTLVPGADALVLSGGSALGLDAAGGVQRRLAAAGRGFPVGPVRVPVVAQAVAFDLLNGGDKGWGEVTPYGRLGLAAAEAAATDFALGSVGGGYGATTLDLKGGLGSASATTSSGYAVGALALVNAVASTLQGGGPHFLAGPYEVDGEFGGLGAGIAPTGAPDWKGRGQRAHPGTTLGLVATDAPLTKAMAERLAIAASGGLHKALRFAAALTDGDTVLAAATGRAERSPTLDDIIEIGAVAGDCLARAIARGVYEAAALPFPGALPSWRDRFGASAHT